MKYCFGVDIGGTSVKMGLFSVDAEILEKWEIPTRKENHGEAILPDVAKSIAEKISEKDLSKEDIIGIGVGVPAPVDVHGVVENTVNLGWGHKNVKEELEALTGYKVSAANDANCAAMGEMWMGAGKGESNMVMVTLGTGVGGGIIVDGHMLVGNCGAGGEVGHICMEPEEEEACGCGLHGCLEMYASATGIVRLAKRRLAKNDDPSTLRGVEKISAKTVWDAVKAGDAVAEEIATQFGQYLGIGLGNIATVTNPRVIVIGGGVSKAGEIIIPYIEKPFKERAFFACRNVEFVLATLGNDAGICGAARLILE